MNRCARAAVLWTSLLSTLLPLGCDEAMTSTESEAPGAAGKADKTEPDAPSFWYLDGDAPFDDDGAARMWAALDLLVQIGDEDDGDRGALARQTVGRIDSGDVLMGAIADAQGVDLWHMCKDLEHASCKDVPKSADFAGNAALRKALVSDLDGYMWGENLYFSFAGERDDQALASTLVHEVNHVLNVSHCSYYADLDAHVVHQTLAYIEEFRAFFVECLFVAAADDLPGCAAWADTQLVERGYALSPDLSTVLPKGQDDPIGLATAIAAMDDDAALGVLIPTAADWPTDLRPCEP